MFVRNAAASLTLAVFVYPVSQDLGWSRALIAGAASLGGLAASVASPAVGWLSDRYGVRLVLTSGVLILGLSTISLAWATVPIAFYLAYGAGRVIFSSSIQIGASVIVAHWFVRQRGRATGILFLFQSAGMVLFPLIASLVIQYRGWQEAWILLGALVWIVALGPVSLLLIQWPEDVGLRPDGDTAPGVVDDASSATEPEEPAWTLREAISTPTLWLLAVATGSLFVVQAGTNIHQAAYFIGQGLGITVAAASVSLNAVFAGVGSVLWGWMAERVPVRITFALVALVMAITSALFTTADTVKEAMAYASLFGISVAGILVVPAVAYANYFGRRSLGLIRGVTEPFVSLGQAIGAVASGIIFDVTGSYHIAFVIFSGVGLAAIMPLLLARPPVRAAAPAEASL
jgi:MFS family permease